MLTVLPCIASAVSPTAPWYKLYPRQALSNNTHVPQLGLLAAGAQAYWLWFNPNMGTHVPNEIGRMRVPFALAVRDFCMK